MTTPNSEETALEAVPASDDQEQKAETKANSPTEAPCRVQEGKVEQEVHLGEAVEESAEESQDG